MMNFPRNCLLSDAATSITEVINNLSEVIGLSSVSNRAFLRPVLESDQWDGY
jgi:hypothetical protein